jgi:dTDP-4-amino-4,6-dideoxygalactose transaminase
MKNFKINWTNNSIKYDKKDKALVMRVMDKAEPFTQGKYLKKFENKFEKYIGSSGKAYAVANGSNALDLSAILIGTNSKDEIIVPAHTWCATAISFARFGAKIIWADIDPETFVISLKNISKLVNKKTKAIVIVHLYGMPANMHEISNFAKKKKILLIEDCAQSLGSSIGKNKVGTFGDISIFSFHSNKLITTLGEGGMLLVNNKKFQKNVEALRHNGVSTFKKKNKNIYWRPAMSNIINAKENYWPFNFCLGEIQCALGEQLIDKIEKFNDIRKKRAKKFIQNFYNYPEIKFQKILPGYVNVYHCLVAHFTGINNKKKRNKFISIMSKKFKIKIIVQNCPLNRYPLFKKFNKGHVPNTNYFFDSMISWPFYTYMSEKNFNYMILKTKKCLDILRKKFK